MNPNEPVQPPVQPTPPVAQSSTSNRNKWLLIGVVVLVVVVVIAAAFALMGKNKKKSGIDTSDTSVYYDRDGYDRSKLNSGIADPMAIKLTARKGAQTLSNGAVVLPACSIITTKDIEKAGFRLYSNNYGFPVSQNYLSKVGKASFSPDLNHMPLGDETISCGYGLQGTGDKKLQSVHIAVNQPFTVSDGVVTDWIQSLQFTAQPDINGYKVFKKSGTENSPPEYMLRKDGNTITISLDFKDASKEKTFINTAIENLERLKTSPENISDVSYDTPVYKQTIAKACDFITNDDLKQLSGNDASPLVREFWPTAVGVADFSSVSNYKTKSNYIRSQCIMSANTPDYHALVGTTNHAIQVITTSYENEQAALQGLVHLSVGDGNATATKGTGVGQEAYLYKDIENKQNVLGFRQGRVTVELTYDFALQGQDPSTADPAQYAQKLSPLGEKIADRLKQQNF